MTTMTNPAPTTESTSGQESGTPGIRSVADLRRALKSAARQGRVDQIRHDHFFLRATTAEMVAIIAEVQAAAPDGWVTAAAFRDRVQNGRKVAIEILDFYDRQGVTLRRGDLRRINSHRADLFG